MLLTAAQPPESKQAQDAEAAGGAPDEADALPGLDAQVRAAEQVRRTDRERHVLEEQRSAARVAEGKLKLSLQRRRGRESGAPAAVR